MSDRDTPHQPPSERGTLVGRTLVVLGLASLFLVMGLLLWNAAPLLAVFVVLVKVLYLRETLGQHVELPGGATEG